MVNKSDYTVVKTYSMQLETIALLTLYYCISERFIRVGISEENFVTGVVLKFGFVDYGGLVLCKKCPSLLVKMLKKVSFIPGFSTIARTDSI